MPGLRPLDSYENSAVRKMEKIRRGIGLGDAEFALAIRMRPGTWTQWKSYSRADVLPSQEKALERARKLAEKK